MDRSAFDRLPILYLMRTLVLIIIILWFSQCDELNIFISKYWCKHIAAAAAAVAAIVEAFERKQT